MAIPPAPPASRKRAIDWWFITPLAFTMLPLIRQIPYLKARPDLRNKVFIGFVGLGLVHGAYLIGRSADRADEDLPAEKYMSHADIKALRSGAK